MLKVVQDVEASNHAAGGSLLDEIVGDGARQMLAAALQAEVAAYVEQFTDELDEAGRRLVVRNGFHEPREVTTAAGAIPVKAPRVAQVLPLLYLHGLSSSDFTPALEQFLGTSHGLSASVITRLAKGLARRSQDVQPAVPGRHRLRLLLGRRDPPQGPPGAGQGVSAGYRRCPC